MKILILASNPRKDLNLDREIRDLKQVIERSHNQQQLEVENALAVRVGDLQELLFKYRPQIVHFCGHGSGEQGLVFEDNEGGEQWVRAEALSDLFRLFSNTVGCVLLNACYSEEQANAIVNHINYVVGMNQEIRDDAAIAFSKGFYRALGYDCPIEQAFEFGKNAIQLEISGSSKMRSAAMEQRKAEIVDTIKKTVIPEHLKPILRTRNGLANSKPISHQKQEELQLVLAHELSGSNSVPRRQLTQQLVGGGLVACLVSAGGIYGYHRWQSNQVQQSRHQESATQEQSLLQRATDSYEKGNIDEAIGLAKAIPVNSSSYQEAKTAIADWTQDQQRLENIKKITEGALTDSDLTEARRLLKEIQSPGLQQIAEKLIHEAEIEIQDLTPHTPPN